MESSVARVALLPGEMTSTVILLSLPFSSSFWRSVASCWSGETMVMCEVDLVLLPATMEPTMPPPISSGMRRVEMRNALVRTRSRYSRFAMSQTLCIDAVSYGFDKDLFEGGFHEFEAGDACSRDGLCEKRLCVGAVV